MKLPTLLKALSPEEYREFEKFLQSPVFKVSETYLRFFKYLCKRHPAFDVGRAELETAYKRCFGAENFTESKLYNLLSGMSRQLEDYLVIKLALAEDGSPLRRELLVKALGKRNTGAYFREEAYRLIEEIEEIVVKETKDYLSLNQLRELIYFHPETPKYNPNPQDLLDAMEAQELVYISGKLRYLVEIKTKERMFGISFQNASVEEILEKTADPALHIQPLIAIYHKLLQLFLTNDNLSEFKALQALLLEKLTVLPPVDRAFLLNQMINYGISLLSQEYLVEHELLALYKKSIELGVIVSNGRITDITFVNIVAMTATVGEFDWAREFINAFAPSLEEERMKAALDLAECHLHYKMGKLDTAQKFLTPEVFQTTHFSIPARGMLQKIAFDRYIQQGKDYDFLMAHLKAYEKFVKGRQMPDEKKTALLNQIGFCRKMATLKFSEVRVPEEKKEILREKLERLKPVISKKWLMERIEAL